MACGAAPSSDCYADTSATVTAVESNCFNKCTPYYDLALAGGGPRRVHLYGPGGTHPGISAGTPVMARTWRGNLVALIVSGRLMETTQSPSGAIANLLTVGGVMLASGLALGATMFWRRR